jgi:CRISPR-associated protein Csd1
MSWLEKLYRTYEQCAGQEPEGDTAMMPISHTHQNASIEITIDDKGSFRRASVVRESQETLIPCSESSGDRRGIKPVNHPLCDKLQYLADDFVANGGTVTSGFASDPNEPHRMYVETLTNWKDSPYGHWKLNAIHQYVTHANIVKDLTDSGIIPVDSSGKPIHSWDGESEDAPAIFKAIPKGTSPLGAFVRWLVDRVGEVESSTWNDPGLIGAWIQYDTSQDQRLGLCNVTGEMQPIAEKHPARIRHGGDKAKLISSNDTSGYTFKGRFIEASEAAGVSFEVTQKAHNALRWLVKRQGHRNGDQVFVAWIPAGKPLPEVFANTGALFGDAFAESDNVNNQSESDSEDQTEIGDVGQAFAIRLRNAIAGYRARLDPTDEVVVIGLESATSGRMAITFYRELAGTDFLARLQAWHERLAWPQRYGKKIQFVGAPSPKDIAESAYGSRLDDKLKRSTVERIIPCIVDGTPIPLDLLASLHHRVCNRVSLEDWEFDKCLGITCSLFKGYSSQRGKDYSMTLESDNDSRDYLFGRLLAIAEHIESRALFITDEKKRGTNAARHMHRFSDRPYSTWQTIELALLPYQNQLRSKRPKFLPSMDRLLDQVMSKFKTEDFKSNKKLSTEFLLAFHCQRQELWRKPESSDDTANDN